jgi:hypothetical protein
MLDGLDRSKRWRARPNLAEKRFDGWVFTTYANKNSLSVVAYVSRESNFACGSPDERTEADALHAATYSNLDALDC